MITSQVLLNTVSRIDLLTLILIKFKEFGAIFFFGKNIKNLVPFSFFGKNIKFPNFLFQDKLRRLDLSFNKIQQLSNRTLLGLENLENLRLAGNQLSTLEQGWLEPCSNLVYLDLSDNNLKLLDESVLSGARNLRYLTLSYNYINQISDTLHAPQLDSLTLAGNPLQSFSFCRVSSLSHLRILNISGTGLTKIGSCQDTLRSLEILDIAGNYLDLPLPQLQALPNLQQLSAGQRNISVLSKTSFVGLDSLRSIELSYSPILTRIEPGVFASLQLLENIIITGCPGLEYLPVGLILDGENPLNIDLRGNGITWIDPGSLPWNRVLRLDLGDNPLHCDCRMVWLIPVLMNINHTAICRSPLQFSLVSISDLQEDEFNCVILGPLQVSVVSVCLVLISLALGIIGFLVYRRKKPSGVIADFPPPGYLQHYKGGCELGWPDKPPIFNEADWAYLEPKCSCRELYEIPGQGKESMDNYYQNSRGIKSDTLTKYSKSSTNLDISSTFSRPRQHTFKLKQVQSSLDDRTILDDWSKPEFTLDRSKPDLSLDRSKPDFTLDRSKTVPSHLSSDYFLAHTDVCETSRMDKFPILDVDRTGCIGTRISGINTTNHNRGVVSTVNQEYLSRVGTQPNVQNYYLDIGNTNMDSPERQGTGYHPFVRTNPRLGRTLLSASFDHLNSTISAPGENKAVLNHNS